MQWKLRGLPEVPGLVSFKTVKMQMYIFFIIQIHRLHRAEEFLGPRSGTPVLGCSWCGPAALAPPGCCWNTGSQPHSQTHVSEPQVNKIFEPSVHTEIWQAMQNRCLVRVKATESCVLEQDWKIWLQICFYPSLCLYNLLPAMEDIWTIWWRWDHGCRWRLSVLPWGQPGARARGVLILSRSRVVQAGSALGEGKSAFVHNYIWGRDSGQYASWEGHLDLRPKSGFLLNQVFQHENRNRALSPSSTCLISSESSKEGSD